MTSDEFLQRLRSDQAVRHIYQTGPTGGMIAVYTYAGVFVLHWEECRDEDVRDRSAYLRDEMHVFETADEVLEFVERCGYPASGFGP